MSVLDDAEPTRRVRLSGAQRRREIIAAAQSVFATNGLSGSRTSRIAEAAGVAESMLYKHFGSKQELFEAAVTQPVAEFVQSVAEGADGLLDRDGPGSERFYRSFLATMTEVLPLLGVALFSDAEEGRQFYNGSIVPLFDHYEQTVRSSLTSAGGERVSAGFLARAVIGIMFLLALDATYREGTDPGAAGRDALADEVRAFVAAGLAGSVAADAPGAAGSPATADQPRAEPPAADGRSEALSTENATLRRILADQAIELRTLRDQLDGRGGGPNDGKDTPR